MGVKEVIKICSNRQSGQITLIYKTADQTIPLGPYTEIQLKANLQQEKVISQLQAADDIYFQISCNEGIKEIVIRKCPNGMNITFPMAEKEITQIHNDYGDFLLSSTDKTVAIRIRPEMSSRILKHIAQKSRKAPYEYGDHLFM